MTNMPCGLRRSTPSIISILLFASVVHAHPMMENALDVVIGRDQITIEAKISPEEISLIESNGAAYQRHASYVATHLNVQADGATIAASSTEYLPATPGETAALIRYRLCYPVAAPRLVRIDEMFLREQPGWSASCVLRIRQADDDAFTTSLLTAHQTAEYACEWPMQAMQNRAEDGPALLGRPPSLSQRAGASSPRYSIHAIAPPSNTPPFLRARIDVRATLRQYTAHGIRHILTGYDHLLFISALVLAATSLWDLIKVVSAFTAAHTLTLTLSVFNIVTLSERIVEPMIAASIIFVALQNILQPEKSRGWTRLCIAFAFGLFHGLGFAGGLKDAMSDMPAIALWSALIAFSLGVEIGHQIVVLPLFMILHTAKHWKAESPRLWLSERTRQVCSVGICLAGGYFLAEALKASHA